MKGKGEWHRCKYINGKLIHDGTWEDCKWYEWLDEYGAKKYARMKYDAIDHFFPPTKKLKEDCVVAFRELEKEDNYD